MPASSAAKWIGALLHRTYTEWTEDHATQYGAAIAYYTLFSLAPLLILAIALAGSFFGAQAAEGRMVNELQYFIGRDAAEAVQALVRQARGSDAGLSVSIAGIGALLLGAAQVFNSLQTALNAMWRIADDSVSRESGIRKDFLQFLKKRALSFGMVLVVGLLLILSLLMSAGVSAFGTYLSALGTESAQVFVLRVSEVAVSIGSLTFLLAVIYKLLPDVRIAWRDVWFGAAVTSCLLTLGKLAIGWYLGSSSVGSVYGAAGSLIVILLWVYYNAQILLFGAEMTQVYAYEFGSRRRQPRKALQPES